MFDNILTTNQKKLLPLIKKFSLDFYLVGGTAIALHLGHRRSIDFDLFTEKKFNPLKIRTKILKDYSIEYTFSQGEGELTILVEKVKLTFFYYPFKIPHNYFFNKIISLPDLLTLGAMKAFALGKRAKWKDYVDFYFILQKFSLKDLIEKTRLIFKNEFNEKLFRSQLSYFDDIDYSEEVEYLPGFEKNEKEIKNFLEEVSLKDY